jgi:endonuclease YncB( thermonuclease family)
MNDKNDSNFMMLVAFNLFLLMVGLLLFVLAAVVTTAQSAEYTGKVVGVSDGDTLTLLVPDGASYRQVKVRLGEIDTPESRQPYGERAKQTLSDLAYNKPARVVVQDTDKYGRTVGRVYVGNLDVNAEMIRQGAAWAYRQYLKDQSLLALEQQAKTAKRGLWALPEAQRMPPWEWRHGGSAKAPTVPISSAPAATASGGFSCAGKRYCREMTSCEEAKFYLTQCGVGTLDGNKDGVPCEALCR